MAPSTDRRAVRRTQRKGGSSMQTHGLKRFLVAPVAALAVGATLLLTPHSAFADQRDFTLVNQSGHTVRSVYVSASNRRSWEEDVLGSDVLPPRRRLHLPFSRPVLARIAGAGPRGAGDGGAPVGGARGATPILKGSGERGR